MKIAIWHDLPSGGGKRALYDHVRGLLGRGHTLEAWCPPTADQTYLPLSQLIPEHILPMSWKPQPVEGSLTTRIWRRYHNENVPRRLEAMDEHCRLCADEIKRGNFDLLFAGACTYFRVTSISRYVTLPKVIFLQEPYRLLYEAMPVFPWAALPSPGWRWWTPRYLRSLLKDGLKVRWMRLQAREEIQNARLYEAILVNSRFSRESVLRAYGLDSHVCYLGVDTEKFRDLGLERENIVVGIGAFVPEKNIELVIRALALVQEPRPRLAWIGNVAKPDYLQDLNKLAEDSAVDFEPLVRIEDEELVRWLNRARLMVYAPRLEPFGLAPLEANACGTPVVGVAEGGVRETVVDGINGLLVEHDPRAMATAIERMLSDPAYAHRLGQQGSTIVRERWSLDAMTDRIEERLTEVLNSHER